MEWDHQQELGEVAVEEVVQGSQRCFLKEVEESQ